MSTVNITLNEAEHRFETTVEGHVAMVVFERFDGGITFVRTFVPEELAGRGIASQLAKHVMEYARAEHLKVRPKCPYIRAYIEKHPEYQDMVVPLA